MKEKSPSPEELLELLKGMAREDSEEFQKWLEEDAELLEYLYDLAVAELRRREDTAPLEEALGEQE